MLVGLVCVDEPVLRNPEGFPPEVTSETASLDLTLGVAYETKGPWSVPTRPRQPPAEELKIGRHQKALLKPRHPLSLRPL